MDIEGMGKTVERLFADGLVGTIADVYSLTADQLGAGGSGDLASNLVNAISIEDPGVAAVLTGLGIRHVGGITAQAVARVAPSLDVLLEADPERFVQAEGVGPVVAGAIAEYLGVEENRQTLHRLRDAGLTIAMEVVEPPTDGVLSGLSVVVTGGLDAMPATRPSARSPGRAARPPIRSARRPLSSSPGAAGSKLAKAEKAGVPVIDGPHSWRFWPVTRSSIGGLIRGDWMQPDRMTHA